MRVAVMAVMMAAASGALADEARAPTAAEQKAFDTWYRAHAPSPAPASATTTAAGVAAAPPQLETRRDGKRWRLSAHEDAPAVRAVLPLCRAQRTIFERQAKQWTEREETWLWVHHTPQCGPAPASAIQQRSELPDLDILRLIQAQTSLLNSARLLMAGNTSCAPSRSRNFRLIALDKAKDGLPTLIFESDIGGTARVSVRKSRADLTAWNVDCQ
jgi:hypothetical protein